VKKGVLSTLRVLAIIIILLILLFPFFWIVVSSFKSFGEIMSSKPTFFPKSPTFEHYKFIFTFRMASKDFPMNILNSLKVCSLTMVISTIIAMMGAYGLARYKFKGRDFLGKAMLIVYVLPGVPLLLPIYSILASLKLVDTLTGLIMIYVSLNTPFAVWLLRSFFEAVPVELEEAAAIDGAGKFQIFTKITLPLSIMGIITAAMFVFVTTWGEYAFAQMIITSDWKKTTPLGLATYMTDQYIEWGPLLAATTVVVIPVLLFFLPLSRFFIKGLVTGALKE